MTIKVEDVSPYLQEMVNMIGMENFLKICKFYGGRSVYIPVYSTLLRAHRNREIVREFNGKNLDELRVKYCMSSTQIFRVIKGK